MKKIISNVNKGAFWVCLSVSAALLIVSFIIPPHGVIDSSVLAASGELFAFATLGTVVEALAKGSDVTIKKGDTEVTIDADGE